MATGKRTCRILKEIRRKIAEANDIEYITEECRYKGDCAGTCPKCEAEVRYLEEQLRQRTLAGRRVALAGISAGMLFMAGCSSSASTDSAQESLSEDWIDDCEMGELPDEVSMFESNNTASGNKLLVPMYPEMECTAIPGEVPINDEPEVPAADSNTGEPSEAN